MTDTQTTPAVEAAPLTVHAMELAARAVRDVQHYTIAEYLEEQVGDQVDGLDVEEIRELLASAVVTVSWLDRGAARVEAQRDLIATTAAGTAVRAISNDPYTDGGDRETTRGALGGAGEPVDARTPTRPRVVVLCGSTRFKAEFERTNRDLTLAGHIVLAPGVFGRADGVMPTDDQKAALDVLHLRKIDLADEVVVVSDASGYCGDSTRREIAYAERTGKPITYLH